MDTCVIISSRELGYEDRDDGPWISLYEYPFLGVNKTGTNREDSFLAQKISVRGEGGVSTKQ